MMLVLGNDERNQHVDIEQADHASDTLNLHKGDRTRDRPVRPLRSPGGALVTPRDCLAETLEILTLVRNASVHVDEALVEAGARPPRPMFVTMPAELLDVPILGIQDIDHCSGWSSVTSLRPISGARVAFQDQSRLPNFPFARLLRGYAFVAGRAVDRHLVAITADDESNELFGQGAVGVNEPGCSRDAPTVACRLRGSVECPLPSMRRHRAREGQP
jgi:hypothetical protein